MINVLQDDDDNYDDDYDDYDDYDNHDDNDNDHHTNLISSFLIGGDGNVYEGRGWNIQGAHTGGFNTEGYGVCFLGNFMDHNPNTAAIAAYHSLVRCMVEEGKIMEEYEMYGHRQTKPPGGTECPGDTLYNTIQGWEGWVRWVTIFTWSLIICFSGGG